MKGWYLVSRGITKHTLFKGKPERLAVWMWLLDNAAWKATTHDAKGKTIEVPRGSVCASPRHIAEEVGAGHQVVRTALKRFESEHMVNMKVTHGKTVISLCNYEKYQSLENDSNTELTQDQHKPNTQKKQGNKVTIEDTNVSLGENAPSKPSPKSRATRLPDDWVLPMECGQWAVNEGWAETTIRAESEKFRDYWIGVGGQKGRKANWPATWRNWMRNSNQPKVINGGRNETPKLNTTADAIAIAARMRRTPGADSIRS